MLKTGREVVRGKFILFSCSDQLTKKRMLLKLGDDGGWPLNSFVLNSF